MQSLCDKRSFTDLIQEHFLQKITTQTVEYKDIANQIIGLKNADLILRKKLIEKGELNKGYHKEMKKVHDQNAAVLNEIINEIGYPTINKVGEVANEAAWLVIQHAIGQPDFMKKCLRLLEEAVVAKEANPVNLAYLSDRIAVFEGKAQRYGTQFDWTEAGELSPQIFDDLDKVNDRRRSLGLNTLEEQTSIIRQQAKTENEHPPADFAKRKSEMEEWRRSVGWVK